MISFASVWYFIIELKNTIILVGTRDRKNAKHKLLAQTLPMVHSTVKVCVTSIASAVEFYVYIPEIAARTMSDSLESFKQKLNAENMVEQYRPFVGLPGSNF